MKFQNLSLYRTCYERGMFLLGKHFLFKGVAFLDTFDCSVFFLVQVISWPFHMNFYIDEPITYLTQSVYPCIHRQTVIRPCKCMHGMGWPRCIFRHQLTLSANGEKLIEAVSRVMTWHRI